MRATWERLLLGLCWCGIAALIGAIGFDSGSQAFGCALMLWVIYLLDRILVASYQHRQ